MGEGIRGLTDLRAGSGRVSALEGGDPADRLARLRSEGGQGVVEFAMVLPVLAAVVFMFISFGKALYYYIELSHTANEGSRYAAVSPATLPNGSAQLGSYLCSTLGSPSSELRKGSSAVNKAIVTITYGTADKNVGDPVTVQVATTYHWIPFFGGGTMNISGTSTMRLENPPAATGANYNASTTCS